MNCEIKMLLNSQYLPAVIEAIRQAKIRIWVVQYMWRTYKYDKAGHIENLNKELMLARQRGVKVQVIFNADATQTYLTKVNADTKRRLEASNIKCKFTPLRPTTHAKFWIIDFDTIIFGSHNLSSRSVAGNDEVSAIIKTQEINKIMSQYFEGIWLRS